jgi:hypothetical protein
MKSAQKNLIAPALKEMLTHIVEIARALRRDLAVFPNNPTAEERDCFDHWDANYYNTNLDNMLFFFMNMNQIPRPHTSNRIIMYTECIITAVLEIQGHKPIPPGGIIFFQQFTGFTGTEHMESLRVLLVGDEKAYTERYGRKPTESALKQQQDQARGILTKANDALKEILRLLGEHRIPLGGTAESDCHLFSQAVLVERYFGKVEQVGKWVNPYDTVNEFCPEMTTAKDPKWVETPLTAQRSWAETFASMAIGGRQLFAARS